MVCRLGGADQKYDVQIIHRSTSGHPSRTSHLWLIYKLYSLITNMMLKKFPDIPGALDNQAIHVNSERYLEI